METGIFFLQTADFISFSIWACLAVFLLFIYASYDISLDVYLRAFCRKSTKDKIIALTFDDGPHSEYTPRVLDILKQYDIKASFFLIGKHIAGNEGILKRIHEEGHQIGNHSFSHKYTFPLFGIRKMSADLLQCEHTIHQVAGCQPKWFRPPFGVTNPNVAKSVKIRGYQVAGWSIRSFDTVKSDKNEIVQRVSSLLHPGAIVLLHDRLPDTPYILEQIIQIALKKGYTFVTVEQLHS